MKKVAVLVFVLTLVLCGSAHANEPTLKIALLSDAETNVGEMIKRYAAKMDISVDVEYYDTVELYRESVNTQILVGQGPDILYAGAIPYWDYSKRGLLYELGHHIEHEEYGSDLYENIIDGLRDEKGKLYVLPCSFNFYVYILNDELAGHYGISIPETPSFRDIVNLCVEFNEKSKVDSGVYTILGGDRYIKELLLNEIIINIDFNRGISNLADLDNDVIEYINTISGLTKEYLYDPEKYFCIIAYMPNRRVTNSKSPTNMMIDGTYRVGLLPTMTSDKSAVYAIDHSFCIANTKNAELALELLNGFMTFENQYNVNGMFMNPIRKSAADRRFETVYEGLETLIKKMEDGKGEGNTFVNLTGPEEITNAFDRYVDTYRGWIDSLDSPILMDQILAANLMNVIETATAEEITAGATKDEITRIVDIYLSEMGGDVDSGYIMIYLVIGIIFSMAAVGIFISFLRKRNRGST